MFLVLKTLFAEGFKPLHTLHTLHGIKIQRAMAALWPYQRGKGKMRQIDVLARAVAEVFHPRIDESKFRRDILNRRDAPPGARAWLLRQLPDEEAQEQLRQLREPGMQSAIFHGVVSQTIKINRAKVQRG